MALPTPEQLVNAGAFAASGALLGKFADIIANRGKDSAAVRASDVTTQAAAADAVQRSYAALVDGLNKEMDRRDDINEAEYQKLAARLTAMETSRQAELASRDARIAHLESENRQLKQRVEDLERGLPKNGTPS